MADRRQLEALRRWAYLLDAAFRVPGTNFRFGVDALIGLIPGLGDLSALVFAVVILVTSFKMHVPAVVRARMVLNAALDMLLGLIPVAGDLADVAWKANLKNITLLERHAQPGVPPSRGDYIFVIVSIIILAFVAMAPVALVIYLFSRWSLI